MNTRPIREKRHRLPKEFYRNQRAVSFVLGLKMAPGKSLANDLVVNLVEILRLVCLRYNIKAVYCFMPDHFHLLLLAETPGVNLWEAVVAFKQRTGYWFIKHQPGIRWQKDFYDHIVRNDENLVDAVLYIVTNPVKKGVAADWKEYPHKGAIGMDLDQVLEGMAVRTNRGTGEEFGTA